MKSQLPARLIRATFWLAPALMLMSDLGTLVIGESGFWLTTHLFWLSFYAFLGLIFGLVQTANTSTFAVASGLIAGFGALIGITIIGMTRYTWGVEAEGVETEILTAAHANPWVFLSSRATGITFPIGLILLVIALQQQQPVSRWLFAGLLIAILLFPIGRISQTLPINVVGDGLMLLFFGRLGRTYYANEKPSQQELISVGALPVRVQDKR